MSAEFKLLISLRKFDEGILVGPNDQFRSLLDSLHCYRTLPLSRPTMETIVEFESELFQPFLHEDAQVNPSVYGAELAFWLTRELARRGVLTSYPQAEDWGWYLEYITEEGNEYWLCCQNQDGAPDKWWCRLEPLARGCSAAKKRLSKALVCCWTRYEKHSTLSRPLRVLPGACRSD